LSTSQERQQQAEQLRRKIEADSPNPDLRARPCLGWIQAVTSGMTAVDKRPSISELSRERLLTYDELAAERAESNQPCELWDGQVIMAPAPFYQHQRIAFRVQKALHEWVEQHALGAVVGAPIDMVLSPRRVVQPDVLYIARANLGIIRNAIRGAADLVVEIISPGTRQRDQVEKKDLYEQYAIKEYCIVDPEAQTLEVFCLGKRQQYKLSGRYRPGQSAASELLPGFRVDVRSLFSPS
jgi:Uma2 family endonuclease